MGTLGDKRLEFSDSNSIHGQYLHGNIQAHVDAVSNIGGPPVHGFLPNQGTGCNDALLVEVQEAIDCGCATGSTGSLCMAAEAGKLIHEEPFSSMIALVKSRCTDEITNNQRRMAFTTFSEVTGLKSLNLDDSFNTINNDFITLININSFYMYFPVAFVAFIIVWLIVGFGWISWIVGLFLTVFIIVVFYLFSILYRITAINFINSQHKNLLRQTHESQRNFEDSIAYWPHGLFAVANSIKSTDKWSCDQSDNPPCIAMDEIISSENYQDISEEEQSKPIIKQTRKRRTRRSEK